MPLSLISRLLLFISHSITVLNSVLIVSTLFLFHYLKFSFFFAFMINSLLCTYSSLSRRSSFSQTLGQENSSCYLLCVPSHFLLSFLQDALDSTQFRLGLGSAISLRMFTIYKVFNWYQYTNHLSAKGFLKVGQSTVDVSSCGVSIWV